MALSAAQITQRRTTALVNNELERMWKEAVWNLGKTIKTFSLRLRVENYLATVFL
jgi:hypothetical protein